MQTTTTTSGEPVSAMEVEELESQQGSVFYHLTDSRTVFAEHAAKLTLQRSMCVMLKGGVEPHAVAKRILCRFSETSHGFH